MFPGGGQRGWLELRTGMSVLNQNKQSKPGPRPNNLECSIEQISPAP